MVMAILSAIAAIPALLGYVQSFAAQVILWYVQSQDNATMAAIADAANASAAAKTQEDRYEATAQWQKALSRTRISS